VKTQAYCDLNKLEGQVKATLIDKLGPEYYKLVDDLDEADLTSSEANEFMSILSELDKSCTN
jgi:hypothetical protein